MNYEKNIWYGWNGGECPVHPETVVEMMFTDGESWFGITDDDVWDQPLLFRIVTPYVPVADATEPEPNLQCWALLDDDGDLLLYHTEREAIDAKKSWGGTIHRMIEADEQ